MTEKKKEEYNHKEDLVLIFFAISWSLWLMRNEMIFQQKELNVQVLCNLIRWRVAFWTKAWKDQIPYSVNELVRKFDVIPVLFP